MPVDPETTHALATPRHSVTVAIFDIVRSRELAADRRAEVQQRLVALLEKWNQDHAQALLAGFTITLGDESEGMLGAPGVIPDLMWELEEAIPEVPFRWGVGYGELHTPLDRSVTAMDGPAFHNARAAITAAKADNRRGGVFVGFAEPIGAALNGLARLLYHQRARLTDAQREAIAMMRAGETIAQAARTLDITRQALEQRVQGGGWAPYAEGEAALRTLLTTYTTRMVVADTNSLAAR